MKYCFSKDFESCNVGELNFDYLKRKDKLKELNPDYLKRKEKLKELSPDYLKRRKS